MKLIEVLPEFSLELEASLTAQGRLDIGEQIRGAEIEYYTYDEDADAMSIRLCPSSPLNIVETNIIGIKHGETITVDHSDYVVLDTDNFNRLSCIEILFAGDIASRLKETIPPDNSR